MAIKDLWTTSTSLPNGVALSYNDGNGLAQSILKELEVVFECNTDTGKCGAIRDLVESLGVLIQITESREAQKNED